MAGMLDLATSVPDRHANNWLVDSQGSLHLIDNGLALPDYNEAMWWLQNDKEMIRHLVQKNAIIPLDVGRWAQALPEVKKIIDGAGIGKNAYRNLEDRVLAMHSFRGRPIGDVPIRFDDAPVPHPVKEWLTL
jgi:hypothetical protein